MNDDHLIIRPKKPKGEDGYRVFSIRIKEELLEQINNIADTTGHSRNELISILLEYAVERCQIEER